MKFTNNVARQNDTTTIPTLSAGAAPPAIFKAIWVCCFGVTRAFGAGPLKAVAVDEAKRAAARIDLTNMIKGFNEQ